MAPCTHYPFCCGWKDCSFALSGQIANMRHVKVTSWLVVTRMGGTAPLSSVNCWSELLQLFLGTNHPEHLCPSHSCWCGSHITENIITCIIWLNSNTMWVKVPSCSFFRAHFTCLSSLADLGKSTCYTSKKHSRSRWSDTILALNHRSRQTYHFPPISKLCPPLSRNFL